MGGEVVVQEAGVSQCPTGEICMEAETWSRIEAEALGEQRRHPGVMCRTRGRGKRCMRPKPLKGSQRKGMKPKLEDEGQNSEEVDADDSRTKRKRTSWRCGHGSVSRAQALGK